MTVPTNRNALARTYRTCGLALFAMLAGASAALAQQAADPKPPQPSAEQREACSQDFRRLCPGTMPGGGRVKQCFTDHYEQLSPLCQAAMDASTATE